MIESKIVDIYSNEIKKYGLKDRRSLFWTKDKQDIRFNILLSEKLKSSTLSILDYGCGTSDLKSFIDRNLYNFIYNGCDINKDFISEAQDRYPEENIFLIDSVDDIDKFYDIVLISGTFNLTGINDYAAMESYVFTNILKLFEKTNYMLTINFLSHKTDAEYQYEGHFYLNPMKLYKYASQHMTNRIFIDEASLPYEVTMKFYKDNNLNTSTVLYKIN